MKRMSFSLTTPQYRNGTKTVTRRLGWDTLQPGETFMGIEKGMGLKKGEKQKELGASICISNTKTILNEITQADCAKEGFPSMTPSEFITFFCKANECHPATTVNRIEFKRIK